MNYESAVKFISENRGEKFVAVEKGKKKQYRLFLSGDVICYFAKGSRSRGYQLPRNVIEFYWESLNIVNNAPEVNLRKTMTTAVKYLTASGLWVNLRTSMEYLLSLSDSELKKVYEMAVNDYYAYREYCEKNNIKLSSDELFALSRRSIKSINYHSWEKNEIRERFAKAIAEKTNYRHRWEKGYDNSIECKVCDDGSMCAWYSEEYRGCGNGHYYLALDERHAMFCEND